jgi:hypothetical protein
VYVSSTADDEAMMSDHYILDDMGNPIPCPDVLQWARIWRRADVRQLAHTQIDKSVDVSTVFLGIDHGYRPDEPILWETMIFGGEHDGWCARYRSKEQAHAGHAAVVAWLKGEGDAP